MVSLASRIAKSRMGAAAVVRHRPTQHTLLSGGVGAELIVWAYPVPHSGTLDAQFRY